MKQVLQKLRKQKKAETPSRITNDTVTEHRKRVLAGGRKFKYPLQYSKHKLVINTVIISILAIIAVTVFGWWQLYPQQNTTDFAYRVTSVVPLPVAKVDGAHVRYSDYLMQLRGSRHYLEQREPASLVGDDGVRQLEFLKQQALRDAIADTYARQLARDRGISVSDDELNTALRKQRQSGDGEISERTYNAVIQDFYGWSPDEYARALRAKLLRQKVLFAVDDTAKNHANAARAVLLQTSADAKWADSIAAHKKDIPGAAYGSSDGMIPKDNQDDDGLARIAATMKKGQVSAVTESPSGLGYYIIRLIDSSDSQVSYEYVKIPLTQFQKQLDNLYSDNKIRTLIDVPLSQDK